MAGRGPDAGSAVERLEFHAVDQERWPDLVRLFEGRGGPKHCWCMVWRPKEGRLDRYGKKAALERSIRQGVPVGILAYLDGEPVAWCSIAPRETYRPLGGPNDGDSGKVWSVVCFFAHREIRGQGVTSKLLRAAVAHAAAHGADVVEASPVEPDSPSFRYMGFRSTFLAAGFEEVGTAGTRRHVMRLRV